MLTSERLREIIDHLESLAEVSAEDEVMDVEEFIRIGSMKRKCYKLLHEVEMSTYHSWMAEYCSVREVPIKAMAICQKAGEGC